MGLFRPAYYSRKLDFHRRERAIEKERNADRLKKAAINKELDDNLRVIAIRRLNDPEVCESLLMDFPGPVKHYVWERDFGQKPYEAAAQVLAGLGDQIRLGRIFRSSQSHGIQEIVITHIMDPELLEEAAINRERKYSTETSANAIARIQDEEVLARIAICSISSGKYAAKRVSDETLLGKIVLQCPVLDTRIEAARRMDNPDAVLSPVREEIEAGMCESPQAPEVELLAWCGDPTARVIYGCTRGTEDWELRFSKDDVLKADPETIYWKA